MKIFENAKIPKEQQLKLYEKLLFWRSEGYKEFAEKYMKIRTKTAKIETIKFNNTQEILINLRNKLIKEGKPPRIIIVKARQEGVSTESECYISNQIFLRKHTRGMIVSYDDDSAREIFRMMKRFYENLPKELKCKLISSSKSELEFDTDSIVSIKTSKNPNLGSGYTLQYVHLSELAKWENKPEDAFLAIMQAVPDTLNTYVVIEATANGMNNFFHRFWKKITSEFNSAMIQKKDYNGWIPVFFPWFIHQEYTLPFRDDDQRRFFWETLDEELKIYYRKLLDKYSVFRGADGTVFKGVTEEKVHWYHNALLNKCFGNRLKMQQEYPSEPREAFIATSSSLFPVEKLDNRISQIERMKIYPKMAKLNAHNFEYGKGFWEVWEEPVNECDYIISVDVAEGLEHGDNHCITVLRRDTLTQVAQFCTNKVDTDILAKEIPKISNLYNNSWVIPENNNHGLSVIKYLLRIKFKRLYKETNLTNKFENKSNQKFGINTNIKTKPLMIDNLIEAIREDALTINCLETLGELMTYIKKPNGRMGGDKGCKDDRVMALAIAVFMHTKVPMRRVKKKKKKYGYLGNNIRKLLKIGNNSGVDVC